MKVSQLLSAAGLVASTQAWGTDVHTFYTTVVTTAYETYCPSPTTFVHQNVTYTATTATTLTITNCPCTITTDKPPQHIPTVTVHPMPSWNNTSVRPPSGWNTTTTTPPPKPTYYHNTSAVVEHTPKPTKPSHRPDLTSTIVVIVPTTPATDLPTNTPVGPSTSRPVTVPGSGAGSLTANTGALILAGTFALLF
ncbi:uncharacterized protein LY79DRAFT_152397 [Colletotrichum navitas]|uniref:Clock-controlled protein 6 n=1 Tax=Colletotrichum navitas TaxID=681940 RepID=A0AAD8QEU0_9PEZI|nr:uncharacterized protein LY79DRAFT_152397 [Colletotrichum navitas]KAK1599819.1 hypothetical protein LY79DRAFT_152397 [Colletotrichum navitas]